MKLATLIFISLSPLALSSPISQSSSRSIQSISNSILAALGDIPLIGLTVEDISAILTTFEQGLATSLDISTTENGDADCSSMTVIFARGTTESGNVGLLTGPPFFDALSNILGSQNVDVKGVDYGATIEGFLEGGDPAGSQTMADLVQKTLTSCSDTKLVMSGYSQGAQLVHNAAKLLPASAMAAVSSVVLFGDPNFGKSVSGALADQTLVICHVGDDICAGGDLILLHHLAYSNSAVQAATFAAAKAELASGN